MGVRVADGLGYMWLMDGYYFLLSPCTHAVMGNISCSNGYYFLLSPCTHAVLDASLFDLLYDTTCTRINAR